MIASAPTLPTFVPDQRYTLEQWLAIEEATGERYEFHDGKLVSVRAMAGGTFGHALLIGNVTYGLGKLVRSLTDSSGSRRADCNVLSSDLKLAVRSEERYVYPHAAVVCGRPRYDDAVPSAVINPVCVVEVTSPSSADFDGGEKFDWYAEMDTLRDYLIVDHRRRRIEIRSRARAGGDWHFRLYAEADGEIDLPGLGLAIELGEVYRNWERPGKK